MSPPCTRATSFPRRTVLATALLLAAVPALAETAPVTNPVDFDTVVVTAAGFEQKITDAPASISVITREELERKQFGNLAQALREVEGVDIGQGTGKTGGLDISIRGMPSAYTLVLIDGRRQNNGGDITPNGFGETANGFMPPLSAIERIEVIRGPMSTLYGSDAVGGVVNIITRSVADSWSGSVGLNHTFHENRDYGASTGANVYVAGPLAHDMLGLAVRGSIHERAASDLAFDDGGVVSRRGAAAVEGRSTSWGARLTLTPSEYHEVSLDLDQGRQVYNNDDCQLGTLDGWGGNAVAGCTVPDDSASGYADELRFDRTQTVLAHRGSLDIGRWESALTYKTTETEGRTIPGTIGQAWTNFPGIVGGAPRTLEATDLILDTRLVAPVGERHTLTVGGQYVDAEVEDGIAAERFERSSWAVFVENEWRIIEPLGLTFGGRYEDHDAFGGHFSPRAYLTWAASDSWTIKGGAARGYRTPSVNQLHDGINGATAQGRTITIGSPQLEPETSDNFEVGFYFDNRAGFNANLTLFHTEFKDMISSGTPVPNCWAASGPGLPGCLDLGSGFTQDSFSQNTNVGEAESRGVELAARWEFAPRWSVGGNWTWTDTEQKSGADRGAPFTNQANHMLNASLDWEATDTLSLWLRGEYQGERDRFTNLRDNLGASDRAILDGLGRLKSWTQLHLGGAWRASDAVTLNATIHNLLDRNFLDGGYYTTDSGDTGWGSHYAQIGRGTTGTIQEGRRLWLSVNVAF